MHVGHLELPVRDPMASLAWYTDVLGFELEVNQGDTFIWLVCGGTTVMLRPSGEGRPVVSPDPDAAPNVVLYTTDLDATSKRLAERGVELERRDRCFHFRDPDGHWFQLVDPGDDHSGA